MRRGRGMGGGGARRGEGDMSVWGFSASIFFHWDGITSL